MEKVKTEWRGEHVYAKESDEFGEGTFAVRSIASEELIAWLMPQEGYAKLKICTELGDPYDDIAAIYEARHFKSAASAFRQVNLWYGHYLNDIEGGCLLYTSPSPRDRTRSRMPSSA